MFTDAFGKIWYKGNLHTHTTNSDGANTPEETIELYKSKGYDFLALTDHWFHGEGRQEEDFLLLNGTEFDVGSTVQEGIYHIVGIGMEKAPALTKRAPGLSAQKIIDEIEDIVRVTNIPTDLSQYHITGDDLDFLVKAGSEQTRLLVNNRRTLSLDDIRGIYQKVIG